MAGFSINRNFRRLTAIRQIGKTYVKIGHGRDYSDVPPISGNYHGTREREMTVAVKITPVI